MANIKTGLLYYSSDTNRFQDIRIKRLKKNFGCDGYSVYEYILNEIYRINGNFLVWDESTAFDVAEYWGLKESKVNEIVRYCCAVGLFDKALLSNGNVLTSQSIQKRYVNMCIHAKRKEIVIPNEYNILPEESKIILEEYRKKKEVSDKGVKVNKENNSLSGVKENFPPPEFAEKTLGECYTELSSNASWCEILTMNTRNAGFIEFTPAVFQQYLQAFFKKLQNEGETRKSPKDAMSHFARWLKIELEKQRNNGSNRNAYTSKQEANAYALNLLQQHKRELEEGMADEMEKPF